MAGKKKGITGPAAKAKASARSSSAAKEGASNRKTYSTSSRISDARSTNAYANFYGPETVRQKMKLGEKGRFVPDTSGPQDYKSSKASNKMLGLAKDSAYEARDIRKRAGITRSKPYSPKHK